MACVKKEQTGSCSHTCCPFSEKMELECVDLYYLDGISFCEIGLNCIPECPFSYWPELEQQAQAAVKEFYQVSDFDLQW